MVNAAHVKSISELIVLAFLEDIESICRKHGLSIGHQDSGGAFTIHRFDEEKLNWLMEARDRT